MFAGEAYNVEMGITNELFPHAKEEDPNCNGPQKPEPNDVTRMDNDDEINQSFKNPLHILADWMRFQLLMRFTDAPQPDPRPSSSAVTGPHNFQQYRLCPMPYADDANCSGTEQRRPTKPAGEPVL